MSGLLGALLPPALGVAASPVPLLAVLLLVLSNRTAGPGVGFLLGWTAGVVAALAVFATVLSVAWVPDGSSAAAGLPGVVLGAVLVAAGGVQWAVSARRDGRDRSSRWMSAVTSLGWGRALAVGLTMSLNPKGLALAAAAGLSLGSAPVALPQQLLAGALYGAVAISTVGLLVLAGAVADRRLDAGLDRVRSWLGRRQSSVAAVVLTHLGVVLLSRGALTL